MGALAYDQTSIFDHHLNGAIDCGSMVQPRTIAPEWLGHLHVLRKPESLQTRRDVFAEDREWVLLVCLATTRYVETTLDSVIAWCWN